MGTTGEGTISPVKLLSSSQTTEPPASGPIPVGPPPGHAPKTPESRNSTEVGLPDPRHLDPRRGNRFVQAAPILAFLLLPATFLVTGPWRIGEVQVAYLNVVVAAGLLVLALVQMLIRRSFQCSGDPDAPLHITNTVAWIGGLVVFAVLLRLVLAQYNALEINAWDFSLYADRPLAETVRGRFLWCEYLGMPTLGNHAGFLLLAFAPLYWLHATPIWLLIIHPLAIALATVCAFFLFRRSTGDDVVAAALALAFPLNAATARAVGYAFHLEIFYPLGIFLLVWALHSRRHLAFAGALLLTVAIKEDAIVPLLPLAGAIWLATRRRWSAIATAATAVAAYVIDAHFVLPHFAGRGPDQPVWYAGYWQSFGGTPLAAVFGLLTRPFEVLARIAGSGAPGMLLTLLLVPVVGWEWFLAAVPGLVMYASADLRLLSDFSLYYVMPLLPLLFLALPTGIGRLASWRHTDSPPSTISRRKRRIAVAVLLASALLDSPYKLRTPRAERLDVEAAAAAASCAKVFVQGALLPHAGYKRSLKVLDRPGTIDGSSAFLLAPGANPYPFSQTGIEELIRDLSADPRYLAQRTPNGLLLFTPAQRPS